MNHSTSNDSKMRSESCPSKPISTLADLLVRAYENRVRERLVAKYPNRTPAQARQLEKQIQKLIQIYAEGRTLMQRNPADCIGQNQRLQGIEQAREIETTNERE